MMMMMMMIIIIIIIIIIVWERRKYANFRPLYRSQYESTKQAVLRSVKLTVMNGRLVWM